MVPPRLPSVRRLMSGRLTGFASGRSRRCRAAFVFSRAPSSDLPSRVAVRLMSPTPRSHAACRRNGGIFPSRLRGVSPARPPHPSLSAAAHAHPDVRNGRRTELRSRIPEHPGVLPGIDGCGRSSASIAARLCVTPRLSSDARPYRPRFHLPYLPIRPLVVRRRKHSGPPPYQGGGPLTNASGDRPARYPAVMRFMYVEMLKFVGSISKYRPRPKRPVVG